MGWRTDKIRMNGPRILVKLDARQAMYGSIEIPDEYRRQPQKGTVIAVGKLRNADGSYRGVGVEVGERVILGKWNGYQLDAPDDDARGEYWVLNVDPALVYQGDKRVPMIECYGVITSEDGAMRVPD